MNDNRAACHFDATLRHRSEYRDGSNAAGRRCRPTRGGAALRRSARSGSLARPAPVPPRPGHYRITAKGLRTALFYTRLYDRSLRPGLAIISLAASNPVLPMDKSIRAAEASLNDWYEHAKLAA